MVNTAPTLSLARRASQPGAYRSTRRWNASIPFFDSPSN